VLFVCLAFIGSVHFRLYENLFVLLCSSTARVTKSLQCSLRRCGELDMCVCVDAVGFALIWIHVLAVRGVFLSWRWFGAGVVVSIGHVKGRVAGPGCPMCAVYGRCFRRLVPLFFCWGMSGRMQGS